MLQRVAAIVLLGAALLSASRLPVRIFTTANGLPRNSVSCLAFGFTGVLWICTPEGLVRFDGNRFRTFGPAEGLPAQEIVNLIPARAGGYWLASRKGFCRLDASSRVKLPCRLIPADPPITQAFAGSVLEVEGQPALLATDKQLYRLSPGGQRLEGIPFPLEKDEAIQLLAPGPGGTLLIGTDLNLWEMSPDRPRRKLNGDRQIGISALLALDDRHYLVGGSTGFFFVEYRGLDSLPLFEVYAPSTGRISSLIRRREGSIWAAGDQGLFSFRLGPDLRPVLIEKFTYEEGLPHAYLDFLAEDGNENLWGSSQGGGIFRIEKSGIRSYERRDGLGGSRIASLFEDIQHRLCVMTTWDGAGNLRRKEGDHFVTLPIHYPSGFHSLGWGWNQFGFQARNGEWWFPTGNGVLRFSPADAPSGSHLMAHYQRDSLLGCQDVQRAFEDSTGDVWIGCRMAVQLVRWRRRTETFERVSDAEALAIRESPSGVIWFATTEGIARYKDGRFDRFPLPAESQPFLDLLIDHAGRLWLASRGGLYRCDHPDATPCEWIRYTAQQGLANQGIRALTEDRAGYIYATSASAVNRIDPREPPDSGHIRHITAVDGLPDSEIGAAFSASDGRLWFGTLNGLAELDLDKGRRPQDVEVFLTRVRIRGEEVPLPWDGARNLELELEPNRNQVELEFADSNLGGQMVRYQYRLLGSNAGWSEPSTQSSVNFSSLPAGKLRLEVRAVDSEGHASVNLAGLDLRVYAPVWQRWWFLMLAAAAIAAGASALYRYRVNQLLAIERLRTRIATDLHDDIGANLSQISILSEAARRGPSQQVLGDISQVARQTVEDMSDIVWAVNPRHDRFEALMQRMRRFASDTLGGADIRLSFEGDGLDPDFSLPLDTRRPTFLAFKEAVNNVAKHSGATEATIRLWREGPLLELVITDNGQGFDQSHRRQGEGVDSIIRRMKALGGDARWDTAPGQGTRVTIQVPLEGRHRASARLN